MKKTILPLLIAFLSLTSAFGQTPADSLIVFVGEKIYVNYSPEENESSSVSVSLDNRYTAKYKILQLIHGSYKSDTIEFIVFAHDGVPEFSNHQTVLLFVTKENGKIYHEKYQYFKLYLTEKGKWASPYSSADYNHPFKNSITVKPEKIAFIGDVSFPVDKYTSNNRYYKLYPEPFYEIKNGRATAIYGNYVEDLFKLKLQTVLKARKMPVEEIMKIIHNQPHP